MSARTIPEPTNTDFSVALTGLRNQAKKNHLNILDRDTHQFLLDAAELVAQQAAEIRWLRNIIHKE